MARKSGPRQLKRAPSPAFWPIHRKESTWATMTRPGPHPRKRSLPLVLVVRETLGLANTAKESKVIVAHDKVKVDHTIRRDHKFPVGPMDIIEIEGVDRVFRIIPQLGGAVSLSQIQKTETAFKICKIVGKRTSPGGNVQISLHDGRNIVLQPRAFQKDEEEYEVGGSLQLVVPTQKIMKYIPFRKGSIGLVTDGKNQGIYGRIVSITEGSNARPKMAKIESKDQIFETPAHHVMPVGVDSPLVGLER